jgi:hypothetical protein
MTILSNPTGVTNLSPENFKTQLKKLSGKSQSRKSSNTGSAFDGVVDSKTTLVWVQRYPMIVESFQHLF